MAKISKIQQELNSIIAEMQEFLAQIDRAADDPGNADLHWLHSKSRELHKRIKKFRRYREVQSLGYLKTYQQAFEEFEQVFGRLIRGFENGEPIDWSEIERISLKYKGAG